MQRYFAKDFNNDLFTLSLEDSYHIRVVMRLKLADITEIIYLDKLYYAEITNLDNLVLAKIIKEVVIEVNRLPNITICQSLIKEVKMDLVLQKSTELNVKRIIPLKAERCLIKLDNKDATKKIKRWETIVKEASEQSKRVDIPLIETIKSIEEIGNLDYTYKILLTVNHSSSTIKKVLQNIKSNDTIIVVIGPEGGLTNKEEEHLILKGFIPTTLGSFVLRTETASISVLSMINYIIME